MSMRSGKCPPMHWNVAGAGPQMGHDATDPSGQKYAASSRASTGPSSASHRGTLPQGTAGTRRIYFPPWIASVDRARWRRTYFWIFPVDVLGTGPSTTARGALKWARFARQ